LENTGGVSQGNFESMQRNEMVAMWQVN